MMAKLLSMAPKEESMLSSTVMGHRAQTATDNLHVRNTLPGTRHPGCWVNGGWCLSGGDLLRQRGRIIISSNYRHHHTEHEEGANDDSRPFDERARRVNFTRDK